MSRDSNIDIYNLIKYLDLLVDSNLKNEGLLNVIFNRFCLKIPDNGTTWTEYLSKKKTINENNEYEKGTMLLGEHNNAGIVYSSNGCLKDSKIVYVNKESNITMGNYNSQDFKYAILPRNWFF